MERPVGQEEVFIAGSPDPVASRGFFLYGYENIYGRKPRF
jgi:hypothetical protein